MDYNAFYTHPYSTPNPQPLSHANLQAANNGTAFPTTNQIQSNQPNPISQLQQNMFFLDPFDTKMEDSQCPIDADPASYSSIPLPTLPQMLCADVIR
jgi:hypothetical protein